jgi:hypothetical protein
MAKTLTNNEKLFARISGNRCSYMDWHKQSIGLVKFYSSNLNAIRQFIHLGSTGEVQLKSMVFFCRYELAWIRMLVFYVPSDSGFAIQFFLKFTWEWKQWAN